MPALLQPVAHALLQARNEITERMVDFPNELLWHQPAGRTGAVASVGFHLQHLTGVLDRLLTYARAEALGDNQLAYLLAEGTPTDQLTADDLVARFSQQVDKALAQLRSTDPATLSDVRGVGRAQLPSTVLGLLVHAAEHTMRHVGQLSVTVRLIA
ncbi:hypothetical protein GCM10027578_37060 [Spirosoma luteolum]